MMIILYHYAKTPIGFLWRQEDSKLRPLFNDNSHTEFNYMKPNYTLLNQFN